MSLNQNQKQSRNIMNMFNTKKNWQTTITSSNDIHNEIRKRINWDVCYYSVQKLILFAFYNTRDQYISSSLVYIQRVGNKHFISCFEFLKNITLEG
jgi:hypothetical protein